MPQISRRLIACMAGVGLRGFYLLSLLLLAWGCDSDLSDRMPDGMVRVEGGTFRLGSDAAERELGYKNSPEIVREYGWYDMWEANPHEVVLGPFAIDRTPVTRSEYAAFVTATGHRAPDIDSAAYHAQGFLAHPWSEVKRFRWDSERPSHGLRDHPVVLVDYADAAAYCAWRGEQAGHPVRLPTGPEWEAACRGAESRTYAWGNEWREAAAVADTTFTAPVGSHPDGATPDGIQDLLGNVFEWTSSRMPPPESREPVLRGCGWDDAPGTCRCAFRHGRPATSRHILIGFRCASTRNVKPPTR
jgi:formylglycine-generating enzyme required for sulfatase activity